MRETPTKRALLGAAILTSLTLTPPGTARADGAFPNSQNILTPAALPSEILLATNFGVVFSVDDGQTFQWTCEQPLNSFAVQYQVGPPPLNRL
jgi:hypothetical protein